MLFRHGHCHPIRSGSRHPEQTRLALASHGLSGSKNMEEAKLVAEFLAGFCSLGLISSLREQVGMEWGSVTMGSHQTIHEATIPKTSSLVPSKGRVFRCPTSAPQDRTPLQENKSWNYFRSTTFGVWSGLRCNYSAALLLISFPHTWHFGLTQKSAKELNL